MGCNVVKRPKTEYSLNRTEKLEDNYKLLDLLSKGSYGTVYRACLISNPHFLCAIKSLEKSRFCQADIASFKQEINILSSLKHPNVIRLYAAYEDGDYIHIVQELCKGGELTTYLSTQESIPEKRIKVLAKTMLETVSYIHSRGICHRDLKPSNFLFVEKQCETLKLIDFGLAANFSGNDLRTIVGSPFYVAPEIIRGRKYGHKCDLWSIGAILFQMLTRELPFQGKNRESVFSKIIIGVFDLSKVVCSAQDLVSQLLESDPYSRLDAEQALKHEWISKF